MKNCFENVIVFNAMFDDVAGHLMTSDAIATCFDDMALVFFKGTHKSSLYLNTSIEFQLNDGQDRLYIHRIQETLSNMKRK